MIATCTATCALNCCAVEAVDSRLLTVVLWKQLIRVSSIS